MVILSKKNNLSELVLHKIQESIQNKEFFPGELLPSEKEMSEMYGVGKSSVREAIKMLQVLGVVQSSQGKGTFLNKSMGSQVLMPVLYEMMLLQSTAEELYEFRLMFDMAYLPLAVSKATDTDKQLAKQRLIEYKANYESGLPTTRVDIEYHRVMLDATRNPFIIRIGALIMELSIPFLEKSNRNLNDITMKHHEDLLEFFCSGNINNLNETIIGCMGIFKSVGDGGVDKKLNSEKESSRR